MFPMMRNGGKARVQLGSVWARLGEARAKYPTIRSEINRDGIGALFYAVLPVGNRRGQPECRHFLAVANQQHIADQYRMVPRLAVEHRESRDLGELIGRRLDQRQLTVLRRHEQQVLIGQQDELTAAVASALPFALAGLEVDAREDVAV